MSENTRAWLDLHRWYKSEEGRSCAAVEHKAVGKVVSSLFGMCMITLGMPTGELHSAGAFVRNYQVEITSVSYADVDMLAEPTQLPLGSENIDTVVIPHLLEFSAQPQAVLDEVSRVLKPDGYVVIVMFNALSLLSFGRWLKARWGNDIRYRAFSFLRHSNIISLLYYLGKLEFETINVDYLRFFSDPWRWPGSHGAVILARKRVTPMTIIKPGWRSERLPAGNSMARWI